MSIEMEWNMIDPYMPAYSGKLKLPFQLPFAAPSLSYCTPPSIHLLINIYSIIKKEATRFGQFLNFRWSYGEQLQCNFTTCVCVCVQRACMHTWIF